MRALIVTSLLASGLTLTVGCKSDVTFQGIENVKVRHIGPNGLTEKEFTDREKEELKKCLYTSRQVQEKETLRELLPTTYLIEVSDNLGDRSFELYTAKNLTGNKGQYFVNDCIHGLIQ